MRFEGRGHSGVNNAWVGSGSGNWNAIMQTVSVQPQTGYIISAWVRSNMTRRSGRLGERGITEASFGASRSYKQISAPFNSGVHSTVQLYIGSTGEHRSSYLQVDDVSLHRR